MLGKKRRKGTEPEVVVSTVLPSSGRNAEWTEEARAGYFLTVKAF